MGNLAPHTAYIVLFQGRPSLVVIRLAGASQRFTGQAVREHFQSHFVHRVRYEQIQTPFGRDTEEHRGGPPGPSPTPKRHRADFGCGELHQRQHQAERKPGQDLGCVCHVFRTRQRRQQLLVNT